MKKPENQLELVRTRLGAIPPKQWMHVAAGADLNIRTIYKVVDPANKPAYDTVYRILSSIEAMPKARKAKP